MLPAPSPFPHLVNEHAARLTALLVLFLTLATIFSEGPLRVALLVLLNLGFLLRFLGGPRSSPLSHLSARVLKLLGQKPSWTPGTPKRFAQAIGLLFSGTALIFALAGAPMVATLLLLAVAVAATLESLLGFCLGCEAFTLLLRWGVLPREACVDCTDTPDQFDTVTIERTQLLQVDTGVRHHRS